ncbi:MAG: molybdate ABC transporter substrate-binding protein [Campylobacterota bacterium]|nr:molybdate ABC transporter substrate-binding protein [Campylobacterota bacterium]
MKKYIYFTILTLSSLIADEINIAVASNVSYAMDELKREFAKENPDTKVEVTIGSSGKLTAQIRNGAPYGLFMSANMKYPNALYSDRIAITKPVVYTQGSLAYLSTKALDYTRGISLLLSDKIDKIAIANPKTAPYGMAAVEALKNAKIYDSVKSKFVYGESISQTITYAVMAADIGLIAKSSLYSPKMKQYREGINWVAVDPKLYTPINQGLVLLKGSKGDRGYRLFYDFILSDKAKTIFEKYGYSVK